MLEPLFALLALAAASAGPEGVWEGTIGNLPVRACFSQRDPTTFGAYYYLQHRRLIALEAEEASSGAFRENDIRDNGAPRWAISATGADSLNGEWVQGRRKLPIRLQRFAASWGEEEGPCASIEFHRPRLAGVEIRSTPATAEGVAYRRIALHHDGQFDASVETFALDRPEPSVRQVD